MHVHAFLAELWAKSTGKAALELQFFFITEQAKVRINCGIMFTEKMKFL